MSLDLLDTPVRLTWDFSEDEKGQTGTRLPAIAAGILEGGVFFVTLQGYPLLSPEVEEVLDILNGGCQLLLSCHGNPDEMTRLAQLPQLGFQLLLDTSGYVDENHGVDIDALSTTIQALRLLTIEPILTLTPLRHNLCNIPDLLHFCSEHNVPKFKLPNAHIGDSFNNYSTADLPRWQDLDGFRKSWLDFTKKSYQLPILEIHDLFLWEIMTPGQQQNRGEYGGCQAGNSLGHIDAQGVVHPCAAWPQPLGKLPDQSLIDIWAGCARLAVREHVAQTPKGCHDCKELGNCFGGCRGLSFHLNRPGGERDLMCSGPR